MSTLEVMASATQQEPPTPISMESGTAVVAMASGGVCNWGAGRATAAGIGVPLSVHPPSAARTVSIPSSRPPGLGHRPQGGWEPPI